MSADAVARLRAAAERIDSLGQRQRAWARCADGLTPESDEWYAALAANPWPGELDADGNGVCQELLYPLAAAVLALLEDRPGIHVCVPRCNRCRGLDDAAALLPDDAP